MTFINCKDRIKRECNIITAAIMLKDKMTLKFLLKAWSRLARLADAIPLRETQLIIDHEIHQTLVENPDDNHPA